MIHLSKTSTCPSLGHAMQLLCVAASLCFGQVSAATLPTLTSMAAQTAIQQTAPTHQEEKNAASSPQCTLPHVWSHAILLMIVVLANAVSELMVGFKMFSGKLFGAPLFVSHSWVGVLFLLFVPALAAYFTGWYMGDTEPSDEPYAMRKETMVFTMILSLPFFALLLSLYFQWIPEKFVCKTIHPINGKVGKYGTYTLTLTCWIIAYLSQILIVWMVDFVMIFCQSQASQAEAKSHTKLAPPSKAS